MSEGAADVEGAAAAAAAMAEKGSAEEPPVTPEKQTWAAATTGAEVISVELPAPVGWKKKFTPKKGGGGTPRRNEIVFIAPTGEEIKSKRQLDLYLKSHPGGLSSSEFDWGTGDTPRRSARISEKAKVTETPEGEPPKKRARKSRQKKKESDVEEEPSALADAEAETKGDGDVEMKERADDGAGKPKDLATGVGKHEGVAEECDNQGKAEEIGEVKDKISEEVADLKMEEGEKSHEEKLVEGVKKDETPAEVGDRKIEDGEKSQAEKVDEVDKKDETPGEVADGKIEEEGKSKNENVAEDSDKKAGEQVQNVEQGQEMEVSLPQKEIKPGVLPGHDGHKDGEVGASRLEVHSIKHEDTQQQPKASTVNC